MTRRSFCTYLDRRYLTRGLALIASLRRHCPDFQIFVLCLDAESHEAIVRLGAADTRPIALADVERDDDELLAAKANRSTVEYYFTCTPSLPLFVLRRHPEIDLLTYVDADLFFFGSPEPLFDEIGDSSIGIIPHRFPEAMRAWEKCGIYNVGWLTFRRDEQALACLTWWRERCLEWCYDRVEPGRFADQKYLDEWPQRFRGVHVIQHAGANVASWNLANYRVTAQQDGRLFVNDTQLIFFHFHHLKPRRAWLFETDFHVHRIRLTSVIKEHVFTPYCRALEEQSAAISRAGGRVTADSIRPTPERARIPFLSTVSAVAAGHMLVYVGGRVR